jgi:hypothetical protein
MMIVTVVMEIIHKWKMNSQIHLSNLAQNTPKTNKQEVKNVLIEEDDDRSESCESGNNCFSQLSSIKSQGELELQQFCQLSSLNSEECSSATAIDVSIDNMTTSKHFEHAFIILSTMTKIKLTTKKGKGNLFTIEWYMPSFEPQNETVHKQHDVMFKHDKFTFHPQKDLVLSMPYQFVANLEPGQFTLLDKSWLKNVKKIKKRQS